MASIKGTTGKDFLVGTSSADNIEGFAGDDEIRGGSGNDTLRGDQNRSNDITLYANKDWAKYYSDINTQTGDGNDLIYGEEGDDWISGGGGNDSIYGGAGNDQIRGDSGSDMIDGGIDIDTVTYRFDHDPNLKFVNVDFSSLKLNGISFINDPKGGVDQISNVERLLIFGTEGNDYIVGSLELPNEILSNASGILNADRFVGGNADDILQNVCIAEGKGGNDQISFFDSSNSSANLSIYSGLPSDYLCFKYNDVYINPNLVGLFGMTSTSNVYFILDMRDKSPDGYDQLTMPSKISFSDGSILSVNELKNENNWNISNPISFDRRNTEKVILGLDSNDVLSGANSSLPLLIFGGNGDDTITGSSGNDRLEGNSGNDSISISEGDDIIVGGEGIDVLIINSFKNDFTVNLNAYEFQIYSGTDINVTNFIFRTSLLEIERIKYKNGYMALDWRANYNDIEINGNAAITAKILGSIFGKDSVNNKNYFGIGLHFLDSGWTYDNLAALALDAAGAKTNDQIVSLLWTNVIGTKPTSADKAPFISLLENGMSAGALAHLAADSSFNITNINLVGLAQTGIEYIPIG